MQNHWRLISIWQSSTTDKFSVLFKNPYQPIDKRLIYLMTSHWQRNSLTIGIRWKPSFRGSTQGPRSNFWIEGAECRASYGVGNRLRQQQLIGFSQIGTRQKNIQYPARNDNTVVKTSYSSCFEKLINSLL